MQVASSVCDLSRIASVVVGVVVDVLNPSVRQVDRVVALPVEDKNDKILTCYPQQARLLLCPPA